MCGFFTRCPKIYDEYSVSYQNRCAFWWPLWCRVSHHVVSSKLGGTPRGALRVYVRGAGTTPLPHNLVPHTTT